MTNLENISTPQKSFTRTQTNVVVEALLGANFTLVVELEIESHQVQHVPQRGVVSSLTEHLQTYVRTAQTWLSLLYKDFGWTRFPSPCPCWRRSRGWWRRRWPCPPKSTPVQKIVTGSVFLLSLLLTAAASPRWWGPSACSTVSCCSSKPGRLCPRASVCGRCLESVRNPRRPPDRLGPGRI